MGGDNAPADEVAGAVMAARQWQVPLVLVGQRDAIEQELEKHVTQGLKIDPVPAGVRLDRR